MCTVLHTPNKSDTALDLYEGDTKSKFYQEYGYYGRPHFEALADKIGLVPKRAQGIINNLLAKPEEVVAMIQNSFLSAEAKKSMLVIIQTK